MNSDLLASSFYDPGNFFPITWPTKPFSALCISRWSVIEPASTVSRRDRMTTLFSDSDFENGYANVQPGTTHGRVWNGSVR